MMNLSDIAAFLCASKKINEILSTNKIVWIHIIKQISLKGISSCNVLKDKIENLENSDKRFAFLKDPNLKANEDMKRLIDDYICKKKSLGSSIAKLVKDSKSFIYTGEIGSESKESQSTAGKPQAASGGFFTALSGMFGFSGASTDRKSVV